MKNIRIIILLLLSVCVATSSCQKPDSDKEWGSALIYMPQAMYSPYVVPNGGSMDNNNGNQNYVIDNSAMELRIFLGVYRSGLMEKLSYTVDVAVPQNAEALSGTTLLPATAYSLPSSVTCPDGKRDASFYLTVDLSYLKANATTDFSLPVTISNPTSYELNESLVTTTVRINTSALTL
jgi:hypothetical protein